ncbi:(d)CMP kinase [Natronoarchaeum sp. GCM10025321]|uniref:(d)CMP kinase n=1 Tax=Natronoarchaeum sp. GCM10025321 TaxID=3252684 RepID=UPI00361FDFA6
MLLTVSGPPGSGKSTTAAALAAEFGIEHVSGGDIFRSLAEERGYTLAEFNELAEEDDEIDRDLDRRLQQIAHERDDVLLESRLSGWLAADEADVRIWLDAPLSVRAARIADREGKPVEQAETETEEREASEHERYLDYYNIDISDLSIYDLSINTARWDEDTVFTLLVEGVEGYDEDSDEGKLRVDADYEF